MGSSKEDIQSEESWVFRFHSRDLSPFFLSFSLSLFFLFFFLKGKGGLIDYIRGNYEFRHVLNKCIFASR